MTRFFKHKSVQRCILLFATGAALHLLLGPLPDTYLVSPWGFVLALNYVYVLVMLYVFSNRIKWVQHFYSHQAAILSLSGLLALVLLMGIIPQQSAGSHFPSWDLLGFTRMTSSWVFALFFFYFTTVMGMLTLHHLFHWRRHRKVSLLLHTATFVVLVAGVFGGGGKQRLRVTLTPNQPVHYGETLAGRKVAIPFTVSLREFQLHQHPARLVLRADSLSSPQFVEVRSEGFCGTLHNWDVHCLAYIDSAGFHPQTSSYVPLRHEGATTAALLKATSRTTGAEVQGWVGLSTHIFPGSTLPLTPSLELAMLPREAKEYLSVVELQSKEGSETHRIRVNSPARIGSWSLYQYSYDVKMGRWSNVSILEAVHDDWWSVTAIAMWTVLSLSLFMCFSAIRSRKEVPA